MTRPLLYYRDSRRRKKAGKGVERKEREDYDFDLARPFIGFSFHGRVFLQKRHKKKHKIERERKKKERKKKERKKERKKRKEKN